MKIEVQNLIGQIKDKMQSIYGERLYKLLLYGSYARGENHADSDLDILIILSDENWETWSELTKLNDNFFLLQLNNGVHLSFLPVSLQKYKQADTLFFRQIRQEAVEL